VFPHVLQWNINKLSHGYSDDKTVRIQTALKKSLRDMDQVIMTPEGQLFLMFTQKLIKDPTLFHSETQEWSESNLN